MEDSRREGITQELEKIYHDPGANRPVSLILYLCKCLERIITHRLFGFTEHLELFDKEREGFHNFRETTNALLHVTQIYIQLNLS